MTEVWTSYAPGALRQCGRGARRRRRPARGGVDDTDPGDVRRRGRGRRARALVVHPFLSAAGDPPRAAAAADGGRGARRRRQPALAPGTARPRPARAPTMIELLLLGLVLVVVAALGVAVIEVLVRRAEVGAALLLGATLMSATLVTRVPSVILPGGIRVQVHDVAFALVLAAAILRLLRLPRFTPWQRWALLAGVMLLLSLVRGAVAFGPQQAIAELRLFLAFVAGALYFATFPPSRRMNDRIGRIWLALSIPMMIAGLPALARQLRRDRRRRAAGAVRRRRGHQGPRRAVHVLPGRRGHPHGSVLAPPGPPVAPADVARRAAPAVRGAAEPAHGLAHDHRRSGCPHGAEAKDQPAGRRDGRRSRRAHGPGVRRARRVRRASAARRQVGGRHRHARLALPGMVRAGPRSVERSGAVGDR